MAKAPLHREKLIQAAIRLYREKGYANTGLSEILAISGAPKGSLYYYFPGGKEALTVEAIRVAGAVVERTLLNLAEKAASPRQFIESYCALLAEWMTASRFKSGCPIASTVLEVVPNSGAITSQCRKAFETWIAVVATVFARTNCAPSQAREKAEQMIAAIEGALLLARVQQSSRPLALVPHLLQQ